MPVACYICYFHIVDHVIVSSVCPDGFDIDDIFLHKNISDLYKFCPLLISTGAQDHKGLPLGRFKPSLFS